MKEQNISVLKFENHKVPEFKEVKNKDWVYYGENNLYPEYLIELSQRSAKHNAIINGKVNYIYGGGLVANTKGVSLEARAKANKLIKEFEKDGFLRRAINDLELFNGFYIQPIYNKALTKIVKLEYVPFAKIRTNADEDEFYYSNNWKERNQSEEKTGFKVLTPFDPDKKSKNQIFYYKILGPKNSKDKNVYPVPEYIGATAAIETDIEIANYHLNNIKTGFSVGTIINFNNGVPEEGAKADIEKSIKKKFQGTDKAGSVAITFNDSSENAPSITSFAPSDLDKQFIEISKRVEQDIFTGHKITSPMLFGVKTEGQLGGRTEIIDAFELFQNTYTEIRQNMVEDVVNMFADLFGVATRIELKRVQAVQNNIPDATLQRVYDSYPVDQLAEMAGLPAARKSTPVQMDSDKDDIFEVLWEREFKGQSDAECLSDFNSMRFDSELTANQKAIIDLLSKDPLMPSEGIAKALGSTTPEVNKMIDELREKGYLGKTKPTKKGEKVVDDEGSKTDLFEIRYKYDWRPNVAPDNNSRDFCDDMLRRTSRQTGWMKRTEIDSLNNGQGLGVWESRGGFWNRNGTPVPFCRHIWKQMVVKRKR